MQIKLAKLSGEFVWHFHKSEDAFIFVHKGRLLMKFRDRNAIIEEGEFIVVPHDVEHCTICEVVLLEPGTPVNTGHRNQRANSD